MINFIINDSSVGLDLSPGEVLLDVLRGRLRLIGTKEGCREGDCGACMVLLGERVGESVDYKPINSCLMPIGDVRSKHVVTIEGLNGEDLNPIQSAIVDEGATQCGFCTPGLIVSLTAYLLNAEDLNAEKDERYLDGNICRCTGYASIKRAIKSVCSQIDAAQFARTYGSFKRIDLLVNERILPRYFLSIKDRLDRIGIGDAQHAGRGTVVAGGTDLFVQNPDGLSDDLFFLSTRKDLNLIEEDGDECVIGSAASTEDLKKSPIMRKVIPHIDENFALISSTPIRHRATVGGNVINASPIGDLAIILLALDASLELEAGKDKRTLKLKDFFKGYKELDISPGELVTRFRFPMPSEGHLFNFEKVSKRTHLDIASVNTAVGIEMNGDTMERVHLSAGGVAPFPMYLSRTCDYLQGRSVTRDHVIEAADVAISEISPITDVRGSSEYKSLLLRQLIYAHFITLFPKHLGGGVL